MSKEFKKEWDESAKERHKNGVKFLIDEINRKQDTEMKIKEEINKMIEEVSNKRSVEWLEKELNKKHHQLIRLMDEVVKVKKELKRWNKLS